MKAWVVTTPNEENSCVVFAETRGQARRMGQSDLGSFDEYMDYDCRRAKQFDSFAETGEVPVAVLLKDGWNYDCFGENCRTPHRINQELIDNGGAVLIDGFPHCLR